MTHIESSDLRFVMRMTFAAAGRDADGDRYRSRWMKRCTERSVLRNADSIGRYRASVQYHHSPTLRIDVDCCRSILRLVIESNG